VVLGAGFKLAVLFLCRLQQTRNGRTYTYFSLVETFGSPDGAVRQRTICYLGRLDDLRPPDWLRVAARLPDPAWLPRIQQEVGYVPPPPGTSTVATVEVIPTSISWCRPRRLGDVYVADWDALFLIRPVPPYLFPQSAFSPQPRISSWWDTSKFHSSRRP
jgi:hypothetical protein